MHEVQKYNQLGRHAEARWVKDEEFDGRWHPIGENSEQLFLAELVLYQPVMQDRDSGSIEAQALMDERISDLLAGKDTAGRYCLIDMHVPPDGGPLPHRHDFEESFTVLAGDRSNLSGQNIDCSRGRSHQYTGKRAASVSE